MFLSVFWCKFRRLFPSSRFSSVKYNSLFDKYGLDRFDMGECYNNNPMSNKCFEELIQKSVRPGFSVLDAGAGEGRLKKLFESRPSITYKGIDSGVGHKNWDYSDVIDGNLEDLSFIGPDTFDVVLLIQVLEHLANPLTVMRQLNRVLKKNGLIFIAVPLGQSLHQIPHDYYRFTPFGLRHILLENGFSIVSLRPQLYGDNMANLKRVQWSSSFHLSASRLTFFDRLILSFYRLNSGLYAPFFKSIDKRCVANISPIGYFLVAKKEFGV